MADRGPDRLERRQPFGLPRLERRRRLRFCGRSRGRDGVDRGIEAISQDKDAFVWVESYLPEELDAIIAEHNAYWKEQGVEITGHETSEHAETGGKYAITEETATENGKPTRLLYAEYDLGLPSKRNIIVTYWASPEGDKKYNNAVADIFSSMTITEK